GRGKGGSGVGLEKGRDGRCSGAGGLIECRHRRIERGGVMSTDIIDLLAGIEPGSSLSAIRDRRLQARENAQKSYFSLFEPADFGDVAPAERYAVAAFVAGVHDEPATANFYLAKLAKVADRADL